MTPQSGILPDASSHALFVALRRRIGRRADATSRRCLAALPQQLSEANLRGTTLGTIAIGSDAWGELFDTRPPELRAFPRVSGAIHPAPASEIDVLLHLRGEHYDLLHEVAAQCVAQLADWLEVTDSTAGFRYHGGRDLTGFVDGTENPSGDEKAEVALLADGEWAGGSYLHIQRYVHRLGQWQKLPTKQQEAVIGRSKVEDEELPDEDRPLTSHISRVVIEEKGEELAMLRRSMPYGLPGGEQGLYFVSYCRTPSVFEKMLTRMVAPTSDGRVDHMLNYTRAVTGASLFAPSVEKLRSLV
ncbi:putative iron-dependent peroxidase [Andreprevotia lacus DSM 23236]|jgi:putative iron-dependent peroxidase|uniref:Putative iron-dependent peroxidase n=1 Tax=Andreprevotia lacus DSM 23236 TaxID=1121001 RepID=A0A1W1Y0U0_9NEIS|nr:Dyp-type peroxidase [Andreprevotia lacus]SMC29744.1 putative iron-dependent peroxidase [Andreprevotia lacus DSM 23236]